MKDPLLPEPAFETLIRAQNQAFEEAENGIGEVPAYRVTADPADDAFTVIMPDDLDTLDRARVAGDVRRRFLHGLRTGEDGFAGLRVPWPEGGVG